MFDFTLIMTIVCFQLRGHGPLSLPEAHLPAARPEQHVRHRGSQGGGTERGQECQQLRRSAPGWGRNTPYPILKSQQKSRAILINFLTILISQFLTILKGNWPPFSFLIKNQGPFSHLKIGIFPPLSS